jgi:hypothetical protein
LKLFLFKDFFDVGNPNRPSMRDLPETEEEYESEKEDDEQEDEEEGQVKASTSKSSADTNNNLEKTTAQLVETLTEEVKNL